MAKTVKKNISHHDPSEEADAAATVGVRHHVSITDGQEGDGDHPQGLHVVAAQVFVVVVPDGGNRASTDAIDEGIHTRAVRPPPTSHTRVIPTPPRSTERR